MATTASRTRPSKTTARNEPAPSPFTWGDRAVETLRTTGNRAEQAWKTIQLYSTIALWSLVAWHVIVK